MSDSPSPRDGNLAADREQVLNEIDAFLRAASVPEKLARFVTAEPPRDRAGGAAHHPDSAELLRRAHQRQPTVEHFAAATLRAALRGLLYDRWTMAVARRLAGQPPAVIDGVIRQLARFAPARCADDVWWVWCRLAKKFPDNEAFDYSERQIRGAWREVLADRRRWDAVGGGPQASPARQACKAALRRAAAEAGHLCRDLLRLQIVDYEPLAGALRLSRENELVVLSDRGRKTMETWLAIRGAADGKLFELPATVAWSAGDGSSVRGLDERRDAHAIDAAERLEAADLVEYLAEPGDGAVLIYLRENVAAEGDWPETLVDLLQARCSAVDLPTERMAPLTKPQRRRGRSHCTKRWRCNAR